VNLAFRESFPAYRSGTGAYTAFLVAYLLLGCLAYVVYQRRLALRPASALARRSCPPPSVPAVFVDRNICRVKLLLP
jgi:NNP family nitrate/nitrite transporter-like MFS transporter